MVYFCFHRGFTPERSVRYGRGTNIEIIGDVAQLARALDWQSRGRRFESDLLHEGNCKNVVPFFYSFI